VSYDGGYVSASESVHQPQSVAHAVKQRERRKLMVESDVGTRTATVTSEIGGDDVIPRPSKR
jgi:hypothetical protein